MESQGESQTEIEREKEQKEAWKHHTEVAHPQHITVNHSNSPDTTLLSCVPCLHIYNIQQKSESFKRKWEVPFHFGKVIFKVHLCKIAEHICMLLNCIGSNWMNVLGYPQLVTAALSIIMLLYVIYMDVSCVTNHVTNKEISYKC